MTTVITTGDLQDLLRSEEACALLDIRELGEAEAGHIFGATFLPRRMVEFRIAELVPARSTRIVVYDEGGPRAGYAAATLTELGYTNVVALAGGVSAWKAAGNVLTQGSNVPSKRFGEEVCEHERTPSVSAQVLQEWHRAGRSVLVCDIRTPEEYGRSRIPGAHSTAGFDAALCASDLNRREILVVVNCAGRTRSIIACETLRHLGVDRVVALENGTMGWVLADLPLEKGAGAGAIEPSSDSRAAAHDKATMLARSMAVEWADAEQVEDWIQQRDRGEANVYAFDARQVPEYEQGHIAGTAILPGALAVQRTDEFMPVRQGRVIFVDDDETRALLAAYWLRRMGLTRVAVLKGGIAAWTDSGRKLERSRKRRPPLGFDDVLARTKHVSAQELKGRIEANRGPIIIDVDTSRQFAERHIAGASWIPRGWLEHRVASVAGDRNAPIVLTCRDGQQSLYAAATLARLGYRDVRFLLGGVKGAAGLPLEEGLPVPESEAMDVILPPYAKGREGMRRYLEWETKLTGTQ